MPEIPIKKRDKMPIGSFKFSITDYIFILLVLLKLFGAFTFQWIYVLYPFAATGFIIFFLKTLGNILRFIYNNIND